MFSNIEVSKNMPPSWAAAAAEAKGVGAKAPSAKAAEGEEAAEGVSEARRGQGV